MVPQDEKGVLYAKQDENYVDNGNLPEAETIYNSGGIIYLHFIYIVTYS